jgi:hypothetical protein
VCKLTVVRDANGLLMLQNSDPIAALKARAQRQDEQAPVLPVDPGFAVEAEVGQRFVKGEDIAFCFRADPGLLGRAMAQTQPEDPAEWKLNYDVFVVCDGHSGIAVRFLDSLRVLVLPGASRASASRAGQSSASAAVVLLAHWAIPGATPLRLSVKHVDALDKCISRLMLLGGGALPVAHAICRCLVAKRRVADVHNAQSPAQTVLEAGPHQEYARACHLRHAPS